MAPMASPPQVRRDQPIPPRAAGATIAAAMQQRQPSISSVVAAGSKQASSSSRHRAAATSAANNNGSRTRAPLSKAPNAHTHPSKNKNAIDSDDESDLDGFDSSEDDDDLDIFYTPNQSPRTSLASSSILFPSSRPGNRNPRQASRKSLTNTTASRSSVAVIAPGIITASNSGSSSIKPGHVNGPSTSASTSHSHAFANSAQTPLPSSSMVQQRQQQQQQRLSSNANANAATTTNGALNAPNGPVSRKPVPTTTTTTASQQQAVSAGSKAGGQPALTRKAPISSSAVSAPPPPASAARDPSHTTPRTAAQALPTSLNRSAPPSRSSSLRVSNNETTPTKGPPKSGATKPNAPSSGAPSPNSSFTSTASSAALAALGGGGGGSSASSTSQPSPSSSLRTNTTPKTSTSTLTPPSATATATTSSSSTTNSSTSTATKNAGTTPTPKRKPIPSAEARNSSSTISLTSTTLENHSDLFSATSGSDMGLTDSSSTPDGKAAAVAAAHRNSKTYGSTKPLASSPLAQNGSAQQQTPPTRTNSLRATRTPVPARPQAVAGGVKPKLPVTLISKVPPPPVQQRSYAYTDDDWAKDVRLLVNLHSQLEENLNEEARAAAVPPPNANGAAVKRSGSVSSKKDEHRKSLGKGMPGDLTKGKERDMSGNSSVVLDKGKAKEKDDGSPSKEGGKIKRKKTGTTEREVLYYTATHGMPRPPPPQSPTGGAPQSNGSASGSTSQQQQQLPVPVRNGYTHHMMMNMSALYEEDEASDGRLSVVTERDEPETPTHPTANGGAEHYTPVFNAFSSAGLRPTANANAQPVEMIRRRSKSLGEHDHDMPFTEEPQQIQYKPRQSSVASWADEYKEILARSRTGGQAMASGTSLLSSPSQQSFAYRSALPVPSGELPSQGTPGFTSLHLARAPPGVYVKDGDLHQRLPGGPPQGGLFNGRGVGGGAVPPGGMMGANGHLDLTRSGVAQTTMASVEVLKGLGGSSLKRGLSGVFSLGRRRTVSEGIDHLESNRLVKRGRLRKGSEDVSARGQGVENGNGGDHTTAARQHLLNVAGAAPITDKVLGFTGYRKPPTYVPSTSVLVQVWAVGVDGVDAKLVGLRMGKRVVIDDEDEIDQQQRGAGESGSSGPNSSGDVSREEVGGKRLGRSLSLRQRLGSMTRRKNSLKKSSGPADSTQNGKGKGKDKQLPMPPVSQPDVGYIPGRSFVGRVLEVGWDVKDEAIRKGEWVTGLLDVRKSGALAEFIVVDRHRVRRVPYPASSSAPEPIPAVSSSAATTTSATSNSSGSSSRTAKPVPPSSLTVEQMALLSLCGVPAYRAIRTFMAAFSSQYKAPAGSRSAESAIAFTQNLLSDHEHNRRRRALVLRGHDGIGAMAIQMLVLRGWRVSAHVPVPGSHDTEDAKRYMSEAEDRVRKLGGEEVVFDDGGLPHDPWWDDGRAAAVRVIDGLREDGDVFDAVLDTMGGREIREASERLLRSNGGPDAAPAGGATGAKAVLSLDGNTPWGKNQRRSGIGQFTTLVGETPERIIPTTADNFRAGLRSLKFSSGSGGSVGEEKTKVGYAWISVAQDVDWEGDDVADSIGHVLRLALEHGVKPVVARASTRDEYSPEYAWQSGVIPFEKAPDIFINGDGPLSAGGTMVVKVAAD